MTSSRSVAAVLTLSFLATSVNAVVFHVDNRHASAADDNPGTVEKPCRHIQAAVDKVQPGDTITVHAGTYREYINWETPGLPGKRITLQSAPGETVVVKGSVVVDGCRRLPPRRPASTAISPAATCGSKMTGRGKTSTRLTNRT